MVDMIHPHSLAEALAVRRDTGAVPYAGGTDLMVQYRRWPGLPPDPKRNVVMIGHLPELTGIRQESHTLWIGASTCYTDLIRDPRVPAVLREACRQIGAPAIQNAGTIGGNICHASPAADTVPPLAVLQATVHLASVDRERDLPLTAFITGPGKTVLEPDELVTGISFRIPDHDVKWRYRKIGTRRANALSKVSFAGMLTVRDGSVRDIRIALGAVGPTVVRRTDLEQALIDVPLPDVRHRLDSVLARYRHALQPITDQRSDRDYRTDVSIRLIQQFVIEEVT